MLEVAQYPDGVVDEGAQVFLPINRGSPFGKFSFEKGAKPMPLRADGLPDGTRAIFWKKSCQSYGATGRELKRVFGNTIVKRRARNVPQKYTLKRVSCGCDGRASGVWRGRVGEASARHSWVTQARGMGFGCGTLTGVGGARRGVVEHL